MKQKSLVYGQTIVEAIVVIAVMEAVVVVEVLDIVVLEIILVGEAGKGLEEGIEIAFMVNIGISG